MTLSPRDLLRVVVKTLLVVATLAALWLIFLLRRLALTVFVAIIFASALRPVVSWMQERLRLSRSAAILGLYGTCVVATAAGIAAIVPSLVSDAMALMERSSEIYGDWYQLAMALRANTLVRLSIALPLPPPQPQVRVWLDGVAAAFERTLPRYALELGATLGDLFLGLVMAYYWLEARDGLLATGPRLLPPAQRARFVAIADDIERVLGGYLGGQLILSLLIGVASLLAFVVIGLPDPVLLACVGALLHVVPLIGATLGAIPPVLVAISQSPTTGLLTAAALLVIHQVENSLIAPRVLQRQVGLSPLLVLIALAAGAMLGGVLGALIAIPTAGALWILVRDLLIEPASRRRARAGSSAQDGPRGGRTTTGRGRRQLRGRRRSPRKQRMPAAPAGGDRAAVERQQAAADAPGA